MRSTFPATEEAATKQQTRVPANRRTEKKMSDFKSVLALELQSFPFNPWKKFRQMCFD